MDVSFDQTSGLADRVVAFGRVLRRAGLKIGTHQMMDAAQALAHVGVARRDDVYQALFSVFVQRREHVELFDEAFRLFWQGPSEFSKMQRMLPKAPAPSPNRPKQRTRVEQAMQEPEKKKKIYPRRSEEEITFVARYSPDEALRRKDFADFTAEEVTAAQAFLRTLRWPIAPRTTRRRSPRETGRVLDFRNTLRRSLRDGGELLALRYQGPKQKPRPVVVLCDISGSMEPYARMLLHFMHAATEAMARVESFVFGTRLTRITHPLRRRDVDEALAAVSRTVDDWSGGTRIGEAIKDFNYHWLRRVLPSDGVVLIISDGFDRGDPEVLAHEMDRLGRNCHRLLWLNPLLGFDAYEPLTRGMQAALPYIDDFLPVHNLASLEDLARILSKLGKR